MVDVYVRLIRKGAITLDDVPESMRQSVIDALAISNV